VSLLYLSLLGGWVAADNVSMVQSMISRPLAAGILAGCVLGDPMTGAEVGAILELFFLVAVPAGGGRMPEAGTASVVAVAAAVSASGPAGVALGVAGGLVWGLVAGWSQTRLRFWNGDMVPVPGAREVTPALVVRAVRTGLLLDYLRGFALTAVGGTLAVLVVPWLAPGWPLRESATASLLLLGGVVSMGILLRSGSAGRRAVLLFGAGALLGLLAGGLP
jgi:hypothetical protein